VKLEFVPPRAPAVAAEAAPSSRPSLSLCVGVRSAPGGVPTHCLHVEVSDVHERHWVAALDPVALHVGQHVLSLPEDLREVVRVSIQEVS
jgi:hypothetical protein